MKNGVTIINDTGIGFGTKVIDSNTGIEIKGIKSITINKIVPDKPITGVLEVFIDKMQLKSVEAIKENIDLKTLIKFENRKRTIHKIFKALAKGFL